MASFCAVILFSHFCSGHDFKYAIFLMSSFALTPAVGTNGLNHMILAGYYDKCQSGLSATASIFPSFIAATTLSAIWSDELSTGILCFVCTCISVYCFCQTMLASELLRSQGGFLISSLLFPLLPFVAICIAAIFLVLGVEIYLIFTMAVFLTWLISSFLLSRLYLGSKVVGRVGRADRIPFFLFGWIVFLLGNLDLWCAGRLMTAIEFEGYSLARKSASAVSVPCIIYSHISIIRFRDSFKEGRLEMAWRILLRGMVIGVTFGFLALAFLLFAHPAIGQEYLGPYPSVLAFGIIFICFSFVTPSLMMLLSIGRIFVVLNCLLLGAVFSSVAVSLATFLGSYSFLLIGLFMAMVLPKLLSMIILMVCLRR